MHFTANRMTACFLYRFLYFHAFLHSQRYQAHEAFSLRDPSTYIMFLSTSYEYVA